MSPEVSRRAFLQAGTMGVAAGLAATLAPGGLMAQPVAGADLIVFNGRVATQDEHRAFAEAVAIREGALWPWGVTPTSWHIGGTRPR